MIKKILILLIIMIMPIVTMASINGDVNGDGIVNTKDYILIRKHLLNISLLKSDEIGRADSNKDGNIGVSDYILVRRILLGMDNSNGKILYQKNVEYKSGESWKTTVDRMQKEWVSNNQRVWTLDTIMDGDESKVYKYMYYSNYYATDDAVKNSTDKRVLAKDEYLTIKINNLNVDTSKYQDIRLNFGYLTASNVNIINLYSLKVYTVDSSGKKHGPFYLGDYDSTGFYKKKSDETYYRGYTLITDNLKEKNNYTIKTLIIIPYGNLARVCDETKTFAGDWVCQQRSFYMNEIKLIGYTDKKYTNPNVSYQKINIDDTRLKIASRMYDMATIKWIPSMNMMALRGINGFAYYGNKYNKGEVYYGPPYTQLNRVPPEKFYSILDANKKMPTLYEKDENGKNIQSRYTWGADCSASVSYSISKYLPINNILGSTAVIWDRKTTSLLGNLVMRPDALAATSVYSDLNEKYTKELNKNSVASSKTSDIIKGIKQRFKSNDKRMWNNKIMLGDGSYRRMIGYTEMKSNATTSAIDNNEQLKVYFESFNVPSKTSGTIEFKYYISKELNGKNTDENLNIGKVVVNLCNNGTCAKAGNAISYVKRDISDKYREEIVRVSYTTITGFNKVEIYPYGISDAKKGRVFKLSYVIVNGNGNNYYTMAANRMDAYLNLPSGLLDVNLVNKINGSFTKLEENGMIANFLATQDMYKGYYELKIGDVVSHHDTKSTHVRMITGSTHIECIDGTVLPLSKDKIPVPVGNCNSHLGIDGDNSYYIRTDINTYTTKGSDNNKNYYGGFINSNDFVAPWTPNKNYTDLISGDIRNIKRSGSDKLFLNGKNIDYFINSKDPFKIALNDGYLPITLNDYKTGNIEKPYATIINPNTSSNIKNGLKGSIYSNYSIISLNFTFKNIDTGVTKSQVVYPNHGAGTKETILANHYSLYYNTPDSINKLLKETIGNAKKYEVDVTISAGTSNNINVLKIIEK